MYPRSNKLGLLLADGEQTNKTVNATANATNGTAVVAAQTSLGASATVSKCNSDVAEAVVVEEQTLSHTTTITTLLKATSTVQRSPRGTVRVGSQNRAPHYHLVTQKQ